VAEAIDAIDRRKRDGFLELAKFPWGAAQLEVALIVDDGDARGIVAAVLEPAEAIDDQGHDFLGAYVSDYAAHGWLSFVMEETTPACGRLNAQASTALGCAGRWCLVC
jgi:hypothetical protein